MPFDQMKLITFFIIFFFLPYLDAENEKARRIRNTNLHHVHSNWYCRLRIFFFFFLHTKTIFIQRSISMSKQHKCDDNENNFKIIIIIYTKQKQNIYIYIWNKYYKNNATIRGHLLLLRSTLIAFSFGFDVNLKQFYRFKFSSFLFF